MALELTKPADKEIFMGILEELTLSANLPCLFDIIPSNGFSLGINVESGFLELFPVKTGTFEVTVLAKANGVRVEQVFKVIIITATCQLRPLATPFDYAQTSERTKITRDYDLLDKEVYTPEVYEDIQVMQQLDERGYGVEFGLFTE